MEYGSQGGVNMNNSESRTVLIELIIIFSLAALVLYIFITIELMDVSNRITRQNAAIVSLLTEKYPQSKNEITSIITGNYNESDEAKGEEILKNYGYKDKMSLLFQPAIKDVYKDIGIKILVILLLIFVPIFFVVWRGYIRVFSSIKAIACIAEKVVDGDFSSSLQDKGEGDFYVLGHHFNQMSNRLMLNIDRLKKEKIFLKNIISDISHQLKTPISTLIVSNELMLNDRNMKDETRIIFLERSKSQLERIEWLTKSLLKLALLESENVTFKKDKVLLSKVVFDSIKFMNNLAEPKNVKIEVYGDTECAWFKGDEKWTVEAIVNIVKNSIEHTPEDGEIKIFIDQTRLISSVTIVDNGEGIDTEEIPKIFDRFYKGKSSSKSDSVGIGLALSKMIVCGQNGNISVKSEKGKGSEFLITFLKTL